MTGWRAVPAKQRREFRRRNHIARDLRTPKYHQRIKEEKREHIIEELERQEAEREARASYDGFDWGSDDDYNWFRDNVGVVTKE
jgi:hypothetical protein